MTGPRWRSAILVAAVAGLASTASTIAIAQAQDAARSIANNESIFIDGKSFTFMQGRSKDDVAVRVKNLGARDLGPGAIVFRSGDKLYILDSASLARAGGERMSLNDPQIERQRSYGGLSDPQIERQRSYGGMSDQEIERQRSYGGLSDPQIERQRSYGGLSDPQIERQRSYGGLSDREIERQRSYGGLSDREIERQRSYGGLSDREIERQRSYGGLSDQEIERQRSYGGLYDPDYANYRLKKIFEQVWGPSVDSSQKK